MRSVITGIAILAVTLIVLAFINPSHSDLIDQTVASETKTPIQDATAVRSMPDTINPGARVEFQTEVPPTPISIDQIVADYRENELNADLKYKGHSVSVYGMVVRVMKGDDGNGIVYLRNFIDENGVVALLADGEEGKASSLRLGMIVPMSCVGGGRIMGRIVVGKCVMINKQPQIKTYSEGATSQPMPDVPGQYVNARFGYSLSFPSNYTKSEESEVGDGIRVASPDGSFTLSASGGNSEGLSVADTYATYVMNTGVTPEYKAFGSNFMVLSWHKGQMVYCLKVFAGKASHESILMSYPLADAAKYRNIVIDIESTFHPGPVDGEG